MLLVYVKYRGQNCPVTQPSYTLKPRSYYFPIDYDRDNGAIANNLKPIGTVIVSDENKSVSSI